MAAIQEKDAPAYAAPPPMSGMHAADPHAGIQHGVPPQQGFVNDPVKVGMEFQASLLAQCAAGNHQVRTEVGGARRCP